MNAPTITQQSNSENIGFTRTYPLSISGLIRMGLILFQLAGFVSAASVAKYLSGRIYLPSDMNATRDAYLLFSIFGFFVSIVIYIIVTDAFWLVPTFILAIICSVREGSLRDPFYLYSKFFNSGAFASAA
ncbi:unnamed protein product, partial [Brachionus calyciflorus]